MRESHVKSSYDVEADWILLRTCNFRCAYCAIPVEELAGRITTYATPATWLEAFNATGKRWLLHLTGGEPSIYPDFVELCVQLTRNHFIAINTNLSHPHLDDFCERIDPKRVHYINAAIHYDERGRRGSLDVFIERVRRFQLRGITMLVSAVMTPAMVDVLPSLQEHFETRGLFIIPKAMRGWHEGSLFPQSYTDAQRTFLRDYLGRARQKYAAVSARLDRLATIKLLEEERFLTRIPDYTGRLCAAGSKFAQIAPNGDVLRCNSGQKLGNVLMRDVNLFKGPRRCDTTYCPYYCEKYTSAPFVPLQRHAVNRVIGAMLDMRRRVAEFRAT